MMRQVIKTPGFTNWPPPPPPKKNSVFIGAKDYIYIACTLQTAVVLVSL
jgi:hypothetical protein